MASPAPASLAGSTASAWRVVGCKTQNRSSRVPSEVRNTTFSLRGNDAAPVQREAATVSSKVPKNPHFPCSCACPPPRAQHDCRMCASTGGVPPCGAGNGRDGARGGGPLPPFPGVRSRGRVHPLRLRRRSLRNPQPGAGEEPLPTGIDLQDPQLADRAGDRRVER